MVSVLFITFVICLFIGVPVAFRGCREIDSPREGPV